ncbi:MAG: DUF2341 domain-containing protein [Candidatus Omnitrophica bacterium]|nr:DUF2341 domain-containing protein [Candidatus Omnitrophota bacterium]
MATGFTISSLGSFTMTSGTFALGANNIDINSSLTQSGGAITSSGGTALVAGAFTQTGGSIDRVTIDDAGIGNPNVNLSQTGGATVGNMTINIGVTTTKTFVSDFTVNSNLIIQGDRGTINTSGGTRTVTLGGNYSNSSGTFGDANLRLVFSGDTTHTMTQNGGSFGIFKAQLILDNPGETVNLDSTLSSTFIITSPGSLTISDSIFNVGTLIFTNNGTYTQTGGTFGAGTGAGSSDFNGTFTLSGGTFNAAAGTTFFSSDVTITNGATTFVAGSGSVEFDSGSTTIDALNTTFNNVTFNIAVSVIKTIANDFSVSGNITHAGDRGEVISGATPRTISLSGNFTLTNGYFGNSTSSPNLTLAFVGGNAQTYSYSLWGFRANVLINKSGGQVSLLSALSMSSGASLTITVGTIDLNGQNWTMNSGTFSNNGVVQLRGSETISGVAQDTDSGMWRYVGDGAGGTSLFTINDFGVGVDYFNLEITGDSSETFTAASAALDVNGTFTLNSGSFTAPSAAMNVAGDFMNAGGTFTHNSGTVIFDGTDQTISGFTTFNNLTKTLTSAASRTLTFAAGSTQTIMGTLTLSGFNASNRLFLRSSSSGTQWDIDPQGTRAINYVNVKDSNNINAAIIAASSSFNAGNNINWFFDNSVSGTVYGDEGVTVIPNANLAVSVNGGAASLVSADATGFYFLNIILSTGDIVTVYVDGSAEKAVTMTKTAVSGISGIDLYQDRLIVRHETGQGPVTNTDLNTANNSGDLDIDALYTMTGSDVTMAAGKELLIWTGITYAPGGNVNVGDIDIRGTFTMAANTITVSGNWDTKVGGAFSGGTVNFTTAGTNSITSGGSNFNNVSFNGASGTWTMADNFRADGTVAINNPVTLNAGSNSLIFAGTLSAGVNNLILSANGIDFLGGANSVTGSAALTLQPASDAAAIGIAGGAGTLALSSTDIAALGDGFSGITIGRVAGSGLITVNAVTFTDPVTIRSPALGGSIQVNGQITGLGNASIYLDGSGATAHLAADIVTAGNAITFSDSVILDVGVLLDTTNGGGSAGGANISFQGTLNGSVAGTENLTLRSGTSGDITFSAVVGGTTRLGIFTIDNANNVTASSTISAGSLTFTADDMTFSGSVDVGSGIVTLVQNTSSRQIDLGTNTVGKLGLTDTELDQITAGTLRIGSTANSGSITISSAITAPATYSTLSLRTGGTVTQSASLAVSSLDVQSVGAVTLTDAGNNVATFAANVTGAGNAISYTDANAVAIGTVDGVVGITTNGGDVTVVSGTTITVNDVINSSPGSGGTLTIGSGVTINAALTVGAGNIVLNGGMGSVVINGTITSGTTITITSTDDIDVLALIQAAGAVSDIILTADTNLDGVGGVRVRVSGKVDAGRDITLTGSNFSLTAPAVDSVIIESDGANDQLLALRNISVQKGAAAPVAADLEIAGLITSTGGGTITFGGPVTVLGNTTLTGYVPISNNFDESTYNVTVNGNLNLSAGTFSMTSGTLTLTGNFTNAATFIAGTGTVVLNGTNQTISGDTTFYNLTKTVAAADVLTFAAGSTQTITGTMTLQGAAGQLLSLRSSAPGTQWNVDPQGTRTIAYLNVQDSHNTNATIINAAETGSVDGLGNTNWYFGAAVSGNVYTDLGVSLIGDGVTIRLAVDGRLIVEQAVTTGGAYTFSSVDLLNGGNVDVYISGNAVKGSTVTIAPVNPASVTGLDIYGSTLIVRHETAGPIAIANLNTAKGALVDSDMLYSVTSGSLTVDQGLFVWATKTLTGTGDITVNGGNVSGDGAINLTGGNFVLVGTGNFGGATDWTFNNLTFGDGSDVGTTSKAGTNQITMTGQLKISATHTLQAGTSHWNLAWAGNSYFTGVTQIAAGDYHTVALKTDGTVWAWGLNSYGQLGDGTTTNSSIPVQSQITGIVTRIAAGNSHTVALKTDGTVWAWGYNVYGQLGDGTTTDSSVPVQSQTTGIMSEITAGYYHTVALKNDGTVWAWGLNRFGQLGDGTTTDSSVPVQSQTSGIMSEIAAGSSHTVALKNDGTVWAWGGNWYGQLGNGTTNNSSVPVQSQITGVVSGIAADTIHTVALKTDGTVWAWGYGGYGELGDGTTNSSSIPVQSQITGVSRITAGDYHTVALKSDGTVWAWGYNGYGQLGDVTTTDSSVPVQSQTTGVVTRIAAGSAHTVALKTDGTVWTWGYNAFGQLGDGTLMSPQLTPVGVISTLTSFVILGTFDCQTSLFEYSGITSNVTSTTYYDLKFNNPSSTFTLGGAITALRHIDITTGTLDSNVSDITVGGNWTNSAAFIPGTRTVTFNGAGSVLGANVTSFNNVSITGNLTGHSVNMNVAGDWLSTGTFTAGVGMVTFDSVNTQMLTSGGSSFYDMTHSGSGTLQLQDALVISNNITNSAGTLDLNGQNFSVTGTLTNPATIQLKGNENVTLTSGNDTTQGTWNYVGDGDATASSFIIKDFGANDYCNLSINAVDGSIDYFTNASNLVINGSLNSSGGTFSVDANIYSVGQMNFYGPVIFAASGFLLDSTNSGASPGANINFYNTIDGTNPGVEGFTLTAGTGNIYFANTVGGNVRLGDINIASARDFWADWRISAASFVMTATGYAGFDDNVDTDGAGGISLTAGDLDLGWTNGYSPYFTTTGGGDIVLKADSTLFGAGSIYFDYNDFNSGRDLTIETNDSLWINASDFTFTVARNLSLNSKAGSITVNAPFTAGGNVTLIAAGTIDISNSVTATGGASNVMTVTNGGFFITSAAGDITLDGNFVQNGVGIVNLAGDINTGLGAGRTINFASDVSLTGNVVLTGDLPISTSNFDMATFDMTLNGDLTMTGGSLTAASGTQYYRGNFTISGGTFTPGTSTATFDGVGSHTITSGGASFNNVTILSGTYTLQDAFNVRGNLNIQWQSGYSSRRAIIIDRTKVPADLTGFPVLVSVTDASLIGKVQNGSNYTIKFTDALGAVMPYQVEYYDDTTGKLIAWVKADLSSVRDTTLYLDYGASATADTQNASAVWDSNYAGVWHLADGTVLSTTDSTANANNGLILGPTATAGQIDGAGSFGGINDYISIPDSNSWNLTTSDGTISVWFYVDTMPATAADAGGLVNQVNNDQNWAIYYYGDGRVGVGRAGINEIVSAGGIISSGQWYNAVVVTSAGTTTIYVNTANVASDTTAVWTDSSNPLRIGGHTYNNIPYYVAGRIDEVRFSSTARSAEWIQTEYNNQSNPSTFHTLGGEVTSASVLVAGSNSINVGGNWTNTGATFNANTGTVTFDGAGIQNITSSGTSFNNFTVNKSAGSAVLIDALDVNGNVIITAGDLASGGQNIKVAGNWTNSGTFTAGSGTVTFDGTSAQTITSGGSNFNNLTYSGSGTLEPTDALTMAGDLQVTAGSLIGTKNIAVQGGDVTGDGTINLIGGTFSLAGTGNFGGATDWTFNHLTFGDGATAEVTSKILANQVTVSGQLTVELNHRLEAGSGTWNLNTTAVGTLSNISQIAGGGYFTVALTMDGLVYAWGYNAQGQLGDGTTNNSSVPVEVLGVGGVGFLKNISFIKTGYDHTVALKSDGSRVYAWGSNDHGQLGNNGATGNSSTPVEVLGVGGVDYLQNISQIDTGLFHTVALKSGEGPKVYAWGGNNKGQLGDGTMNDALVPVEVLGMGGIGNLQDIVQVAAGFYHTVALKTDGTVLAWGDNASGQLGDGTMNDSSVPVEVVDISGFGILLNISQIDAGSYHSVALSNNGFWASAVWDS